MRHTWRALMRLALKAALMVLAVNIAFALLNPVPALGRLSAYHVLLPPRLRLPFGETPERAYNLSLFDLNAMFASHAIAAPKAKDEFRVVLLGDSSTWGFLLRPEDTLSGLLNAMQLRTADGRRVCVYNLGYPIMSLAKDLLILRQAMSHQPDLVIWLVTLESFPASAQLTHPLVQRNPEAMHALTIAYHLRSIADQARFTHASFIERTFWGQRRALADWLRLQLYGVLWAATGIDQYYPESYEPAQRDLDPTLEWKGFHPPQLPEDALAFDVLEAGAQLAREGGAEFMLVNEPILISQGRNSDLRYNFFYPRWAYDTYRQRLAERARQQRWHYLDAWNLVPPSEFTNSAVHLTPRGSQLLAEQLAAWLSALPLKGSERR